jgi:predicted nuclease with TOPRIM domain
MSDSSESVHEMVQRHIGGLAAMPRTSSAELFVHVLETLRDLCLELPELPLGSERDLAERVLHAANQMILGLLYHLADAGAARAGLEDLQQQVETRMREFRAEQEPTAALKHRLRILDADLDTLREERRLLESIAGYEQLRERLRTEQGDQSAYQQLLAGAAHRATRQREAFEELSRQVEELLAKQRQVLQQELQVEEAGWQPVEREVFGA